MHGVLLALLVPNAAAIVAVVTLSVTSDDGGSAVASSGGAPTVDIRDFEFEPSPLVVPAGAKITVVNSDDTTHTLTSDKKGLFDTGDLDGKARTTIEVGEAGKYAYFCEIHDYMRGVIEVTG